MEAKSQYIFPLVTQPDPGFVSDCRKQLESSGLSAQDANQQFSDLQNKGVQLTARSLELLSLSDPDQYSSYVQSAKGQPLVQQTCITCMDVIKQALDEVNKHSSTMLSVSWMRCTQATSKHNTVSKWLCQQQAFEKESQCTERAHS